MTIQSRGLELLILLVALLSGSQAIAQMPSDTAEDSGLEQNDAQTETTTDEAAAPAELVAPTSTEEEPPPPSSMPAAPTETETLAKVTPSEAATPATPKNGDKLQLSTVDGNLVFRPLLVIQPSLVVPIDGQAEHPTAGIGVMFKRARFGFDGSLFKIASVRVLGDFRRGTPELVDAYADLDPLGGRFVIRAGWFRPWFGHQRIGSSSRLQFVEYAQAWTDRQLGLHLNRDMAISLYGMAADAYEWGFTLFNGEKSFSLDDNRDFGVAARFAVHPLSAAKVGKPLKSNDETAFNMPDKPALSVGGALSVESRRDRAIAPDEEAEPLTYDDIQVKAGGELGFQWSRLAFTSEFFFFKTILKDVENELTTAIDMNTQTAALRDTGLSAYLQAGLMVVPELLEIAARFDWVDEHIDTDGSRFYPAFAANIYIRGHNLKLQTFYRANIAAGYDEAHSNWRDKPSHLIALQLQAGF